MVFNIYIMGCNSSLLFFKFQSSKCPLLSQWFPLNQAFKLLSFSFDLFSAFLVRRGIPGSSNIFSAPDLDSIISPRLPASGHWGKKDLGEGHALCCWGIVAPVLLSGQSYRTNVHTHLHLYLFAYLAIHPENYDFIPITNFNPSSLGLI